MMPGVRWTEKERRALRRQVLRERRALEQVELPGRSEHSIRRQAARMGLVDQRPGRFKWPADQVRKLEKLAREGLSAAEISRFELVGDPPRSLWAIRKMWGRLSLADRGRSQRMRDRKRWRPGELAKFDAYLRRHSRQLTPEQIGREWGLARSTVARRQTELGIKRPRAEVLRMEYSQRKQRDARERLRRRNLKYWRERRERRVQELEELAQEYSRRGQVATQVCVDCQRAWPRRTEFFHVSEKQISIGTSRYFKHRCVLCENQRRRRREQSRRLAE